MTYWFSAHLLVLQPRVKLNWSQNTGKLNKTAWPFCCRPYLNIHSKMPSPYSFLHVFVFYMYHVTTRQALWSKNNPLYHNTEAAQGVKQQTFVKTIIYPQYRRHPVQVTTIFFQRGFLGECAKFYRGASLAFFPARNSRRQVESPRKGKKTSEDVKCWRIFFHQGYAWK